FIRRVWRGTTPFTSPEKGQGSHQTQIAITSEKSLKSLRLSLHKRDAFKRNIRCKQIARHKIASGFIPDVLL
ncbi:MAG: hypothetical protein ABIH23_15765, partial [bacterium]